MLQSDRWLSLFERKLLSVVCLLLFALIAITDGSRIVLSQASGGDEVWIVALRAPSTVEKALSWSQGLSKKARREQVTSSRALDYRKELEAVQDRIVRRLDDRGLLRRDGGPGIEVTDRRTFLFNTLVVKGSRQNVEEMRRFPEVRALYPNLLFEASMDLAPAIVGAPALWELLGGADKAGAGIKIGVIDSGINHLHPMLSGEGMSPPEGFPKREIDFTNGKVIVASNYVRPEFGYDPQEITTAQPESGHGSSVAGVAAGRRITSPFAEIAGIAPGAFLGSYKVFGDPGVNPGGRYAGIQAAFEDAVMDGMDVINMSLGGSLPLDPESHPLQVAIRNATELGVVVVTSAGNGGPSEATITFPANSADLISVAAVSNGGIFNFQMEVTSTQSPLPDGLESIGYLPGVGVGVGAGLGPGPLASIADLDPSERACSPLPLESLTGKWALVRSGGCFFVDKAENVLAAGAEAMIVYNNSGQAVTMGVPEGRSFPMTSVMISTENGEALRDLLLVQPQVFSRLTDDFRRSPIDPDAVSRFSSRGPNGPDQESRISGLKPDLSAIGEQVHTASLSDSYVTNIRGTSFSSPMVAGGAALLLQQHPGWTATAVKSALVNTASKVATVDDGPARVIDTGNGRLDLARAASASTMLSPVGISFGIISDSDLEGFDLAPGVPIPLQSRTHTVTNLGATSKTYRIDLVNRVPMEGAVVTVSPQTITLGPGESGGVRLDFELVPPISSGELEGYVRYRQVGGPGEEMTFSYWGLLAIGRRTSFILRVAQDGSESYRSIQEALQDAQPGNTIEIADDTVYNELIRIENGFRPFDGITLRAAPGTSPVVVSTSADEPAIRVTEVEDVTIEGLTIRGGVSLNSSSVVLRDNRFERGQGLISGGSTLLIANNDFRDSESHGVNLFGGSAIVLENTFGPGNAGNGLSGSNGRNLLFDNEIVGSTGFGVNLSGGFSNGLSSTGVHLVKGNTITGTSPSPAPEDATAGFAAANGANITAIGNVISDNSGDGLLMERFVVADLLRNRIHSNLGAGLNFYRTQATVTAQEIVENSAGIRAERSTLDIRSSLIDGSNGAQSGYGLLAVNGTIQLRNLTVHGNSGRGIDYSGVTGGIFNTLIWNNGQGATPEASGKLQNSLIGVDPSFTDPSEGDFGLQPGSAAIDAGSNTRVRSESDLLGHQRIAGDAVDIGAVEFGSPRAVPLILPVLSVAEGEFTGVAATNLFQAPGRWTEASAGEATTTLSLTAYDTEGRSYGSFSIDLAGRAQFSRLLGEIFDDLRPGWVEVASTRPDALSFTLAGEGTLEFLDGVALSTPQGADLILTEVRRGSEENTTLCVVNPGAQPMQVRIRWANHVEPDRVTVRELPAHGMLLGTMKDLFGEGGADGGFLRVSSGNGEPLYAMESFGTSRARGALAALNVESAAERMFGAQLAIGPDLDSIVKIVALGPGVTLNLEAISEDGQTSFNTVSGHGFGESEAGIVTVSARERFGFSEGFVGWLRVTSQNTPILGSVSFQNDEGDFLATVPLQSEGAREFVFSHVAQTSEIFTGLALLQPSDGVPLRTPVTIEVFDREGLNRQMAFLKLGRGEKVARLLSELISIDGSLEGGFIRVRSVSPLIAFEIFGSNASRFLATVPAQVLVE